MTTSLRTQRLIPGSGLSLFVRTFSAEMAHVGCYCTVTKPGLCLLNQNSARGKEVTRSKNG